MPTGEPGGPDSEIFYDFGTSHNKKFGETCHPNCDCGRFLEIGNNVFMTYQKTKDGFEPLAKKNIDFGGGLERITAAVNHNPDIFKTDSFSSITNILGEDITSQSRVIADHIKASIFLITDGVLPGNKAQGYFLRRLLRRAMVKRQGRLPLGLVDAVVNTYHQTQYFLNVNIDLIKQTITDENDKFDKTLHDGLKKLGQVSPFDLYQSYGFPLEIIEELYQEKGLKLDKEEFAEEKKKHQEISRTASAGMFKGGLQDQSEIVTKYHTATHLLHSALREVLGTHVSQKGSNITAERLRFDFSHPEKLTDEQIRQVEDLVNDKTKEDIQVERVEMPKTQALAEGAMAFFPEKYPEITSVYSIGDFSKELCGGPHVQRTGEIGRIKITRQEAVSAGVRRIYATAIHQ